MKLFIITLSLFVCLGWVLPSAAGAAKSADPGFTAADLLQWKEQGRESFYHTAVGMMGAVVAQAQSGYGTCISNWYFKDAASQAKANMQLDKAMQRYQDHFPQAIIISWVKHICGPLPF